MKKELFIGKTQLEKLVAKALGVLSLILLLNFSSYGQCAQFGAAVINTICDDEGTINDHLDDTYTVEVWVYNDLNPTNTWTSSDASFTNENYPMGFGVFTFGPYLITGGNVTVTFTDDQDACPWTLTFAAPSPCSAPPFVCPDFDICYTLMESDNCSATYMASISGNIQAYSSINNLFFGFSAINGVIEDISFSDVFGHLANKGVTINNANNTLNGGSGMNGIDLASDAVIIKVSAVPGNCVTLSDNPNIMWFGNEICFSNANICNSPDPFCAVGVDVSGNVQAPGSYDCPGTSNHGIEGAEISITTQSGESCNTTTDNSGDYTCEFCDDGPYEICVTTTCDEPCGVSDYDIVLLREYILGKRVWNKDLWFIGDVDGSGTASTLDLLLIQRELLGFNPPQITNWCRFVPVSDYGSAPAISYQNASVYAAIDNCIIVTDPIIESTDFVRYMLGDIDFSCDDCIHGDLQGDVPIVISDEELSKSIVKSPVTDNIHVLTMHIDIPLGSNIRSVESSLPNLEYNIKDGDLHIIWIDQSKGNVGFPVQAGEEIITIHTDEQLVLASEGSFLLSDIGGAKKLTQVETTKNKKMFVESELTLNDRTLLNVNNVSENTKISVYDMFGHLYHTQLINKNTKVIYTDNSLKSGIYIIRVESIQSDETIKVYIP